MSLNKSTGNMYPWVTHTWNPIRGRCPHECSYCYMRRFWPKKGFSFAENELDGAWRWNKKIFVGSSIDMWASEIPEVWIAETLRKCRRNSNSQYFFQTKNAKRMYEFMQDFPTDSILGVTIESNRDHPLSKAPKIEDRTDWMEYLWHFDFTVMVSIEPIMDFDLGKFVNLIKRVAPLFVSIGADSKGHHLPEPPMKKVLDLIDALKEITEVKIKDNLERIIGPGLPRVNKIERDGIV